MTTGLLSVGKNLKIDLFALYLQLIAKQQKKHTVITKPK